MIPVLVGRVLHFPSGAPVLNLAIQCAHPSSASKRIWILFCVPLSQLVSPDQEWSPRLEEVGQEVCFLCFFFLFLFFLNKSSFLYNHELHEP